MKAVFLLYFQRFRTQIGVIWGHRALPEYVNKKAVLGYNLGYFLGYGNGLFSRETRQIETAKAKE